MQGLHIHGLSLYATKVFSKWREVFINGVDEGLDESIKKIEGIGALDDPLLTLGATKSTLPATSKAAASKRGGKRLSIPNPLSVNTFSEPRRRTWDWWHGWGSHHNKSEQSQSEARKFHVIYVGSCKLENDAWAGKNWKTVGHFYYFRLFLVTELLKSQWSCMQHKYGFRWGSDSQLFHTRFLIKRRTLGSSQPAP